MPEYARGGYIPLPDGRDTIPVPFDRESERIITRHEARKLAADERVRAITERHIKRWRVALDRMAEWPEDGPDCA